MAIIGVDIGGTNIDIGILDNDGKVLKSTATPTRAKTGPESCIKRVVAEIKGLVAKCSLSMSDVNGVGVGCPGPLDLSSGTIVYSPNFPSNWVGFSAKNYLQDCFDVPVEIDNDANAAVLAELWVGGAKEIDDFLLLTLGTGIGGGIVANGKIVRGSKGFGAELGHIGIYPGGETCGCGKQGCLEAYASATAIVKMAKRLLKAPEYKKGSSPLEKKGKNKIDAKFVFDLAKSRDPLAVQAVKKAGEALGLGIGSLLNIFNPKKVILAGRMSRSFDIIYPYIRESCDKSAFKSIVEDVSIEPSSLGTNAGLIGAAAVFAYEHNLIRKKTRVIKISKSYIIAAATIGVSGLRVAIVCVGGKEGPYRILSQRYISGRLSSQEMIWDATINAFDEALGESSRNISDLSGFAIITPGPIDKKNKQVLNSPNMNWSYVDVEKELRRRIEGLTTPIYLERDAIGITLAELYFGHGRGLENFACIYIGTGIGGGFVFNGKVFFGARDQAGEIGHEIIDRRGPETCHCQNKGCLECYASGVALSRYCFSDIILGKPSLLSLKRAEEIYYFDVVSAANKNDKVAINALEEMGEAIAIGVSNLINYLDPQKVVLSGPLGPLDRGSKYFLERVREEAARRIIISNWSKENIIPTAIADIEVAGAVASFIAQHPEIKTIDQH